MAYYLGIDGGGTKTRCVLADETTIIAKAMTGGSNIVRLGEQQAREALVSVIGQVCSAAKISPSEIRGICMGAAGAGRAEIAAKVGSILAEIVSPNTCHVEVVGDNDIALEAAFGAGAGVIVVAGTGSIAYGRDGKGQTARAGGWGFAVSDEGSGHWIGRQSISAILDAQDRGVETALTTMVLQTWKLTGIDGLVQQANSTPAPDFPRLFPGVLRVAEEGDAVAGELLSKAGIALAGLAETVLHRIAPKAASTALAVAMTGSVFRQSRGVRQVFQSTLQSGYTSLEVRQQIADPVEGALTRARRL